MKLANMEPLTSPFVDRSDEMHCPLVVVTMMSPWRRHHEDDLDERAKYGGNKGDLRRSDPRLYGRGYDDAARSLTPPSAS